MDSEVRKIDFVGDKPLPLPLRFSSPVPLFLGAVRSSENRAVRANEAHGLARNGPKTMPLRRESLFCPWTLDKSQKKNNTDGLPKINQDLSFDFGERVGVFCGLLAPVPASNRLWRLEQKLTGSTGKKEEATPCCLCPSEEETHSSFYRIHCFDAEQLIQSDMAPLRLSRSEHRH